MIDFGIKDALDILCVSLLLFYLYQLMRDSSSAKIFSGIIVFILMWMLISQVFEMRLMGTILDKVVSVGGIALVVLFQEEIRHFFSSIGSRQHLGFVRHLFSKRKRRENPHHEEIMPIIMACTSMAKQKVGALIVVERNVGLREIINSGDTINADINQRLIENIFFKNSPLHDGAMVISHKRIRAAGCILPVSHDSDIPKNLGLRHRAALGISQKSDCLAIIVSEETGNISIAQNGSFHLRLNGDELESALRNAL